MEESMMLGELKGLEEDELEKVVEHFSIEIQDAIYEANERLFDEELQRQIREDNLLDELAESLATFSEEELSELQRQIEEFED